MTAVTNQGASSHQAGAPTDLGALPVAAVATTLENRLAQNPPDIIKVGLIPSAEMAEEWPQCCQRAKPLSFGTR